MIKLVENNSEALLVLDKLKVDFAPLLASKMFTEGFGVNQDFLQFYAAFNDKSMLSAAFVKCNDRVFCLIETLYDVDEILFFLNGFRDFKIFISSHFKEIIDRKNFYYCSLMKKKTSVISENTNISQIESRPFTDIIMKGKENDYALRFYLNNSHLLRHGYLKNFAYKTKGQTVSVASIYSDNKLSYLCNVFTPQEFRGRGYASDLINAITQDKEFHLICSNDLTTLYKKCGFEEYSRWVEFLY